MVMTGCSRGGGISDNWSNDSGRRPLNQKHGCSAELAMAALSKYLVEVTEESSIVSLAGHSQKVWRDVSTTLASQRVHILEKEGSIWETLRLVQHAPHWIVSKAQHNG